MALKRKLNLGFGGDPDAVNLEKLQHEGQVGGVWERKQDRWQLVKLVDAGPSVAGDLGYVKSYDGKYEATRTIGNSSRNEVAGVFTTAVTVNYFTLIRCGGTFNTKAGAGTFARGTYAISDTSGNQVIPKILEGDAGAGVGSVFQFVGVAQGATASGKVSLALDVPYM